MQFKRRVNVHNALSASRETLIRATIFKAAENVSAAGEKENGCPPPHALIHIGEPRLYK